MKAKPNYFIIDFNNTTPYCTISRKSKNKNTKKCKRYNPEFQNFLKLPNTTASPSNLRDNADFIMSMMYRKALKRTTVAR
jgi:hypothetical protein